MTWDGKEQRRQSFDRRKEEWHLKKEVPIATIITILITISAGTIWLASLKKDIDLHWQAFQQYTHNEIEKDQEAKKSNSLILSELKEVRKDIVLIKIALAERKK